MSILRGDMITNVIKKVIYQISLSPVMDGLHRQICIAGKCFKKESPGHSFVSIIDVISMWSHGFGKPLYLPYGSCYLKYQTGNIKYKLYELNIFNSTNKYLRVTIRQFHVF